MNSIIYTEIFQTAFEHANIGIIQVSLDGEILCANKECSNIWGYPINTLTKMNINDLTTPESINLTKDFIELGKNENEKTVFEKKYFHKNGQIITCEVSFIFIRDSQNKPLSIISYIRDFTQHRKQKENLITRLHYEKNLVKFSNTLMLKEKDAISKSLHYLLLASNSSRVYIFENFMDNENRLSIKQTYEVCAPGIEPEIDNPQLQHIVYERDGFARWKTELSKNKIISGIVSDFPHNEREILQPQG